MKFNKSGITINNKEENLPIKAYGIKPRPNAVNESGGIAYKKSPEHVLLNILFNSKVTDTSFKNSDDIVKELKQAIHNVDKEFAMKATAYARHVIGNKSITHIAGVEIARRYSGVHAFITALCLLPTDAMEMLAYYKATNENKSTIIHSLKKGIRTALTRFSGFQIDKYNKNNNAISLRDLLKLFHPNPKEDTLTAYKALAAGEKYDKQVTTIQQILSNNAEKKEMDAQLKELLFSKKLGYSALIFNFARFMLMKDIAVAQYAVEYLTNETAIAKSKESPMRYWTLLEALDSSDLANATDFYNMARTAVINAMNIAVKNVPIFKGKRVLLAQDISGSMSGTIETKHGNTTSSMSKRAVAALFSAAFLKSNNIIDHIAFNSSAINLLDKERVSLPNYNVYELAQALNKGTGSTDFSCIFDYAKQQEKAYDIIIIITDDQSWQHKSCAPAYIRNYRKCVGNPNVKLFIWDIEAGNTCQTFADDVNSNYLYGWSEKVFDIIDKFMVDLDAFKNTILNYDYTSYTLKGNTLEPLPTKFVYKSKSQLRRIKIQKEDAIHKTRKRKAERY